MPWINDFKTRQKLFGAIPPNVRLQQPQMGMPILGPNRPQVQQPPQQPDMSGMYDDPSPSLDAYKQHLMSMPTRDNFKPTKMSRVMAAIVGAGEGLDKGAGAGFKASSSMIDEPYNTALTDYSNKGNVLGRMADIESANTKNKLDYIKTWRDDQRADKLANNTINNTNSEISTREKLTPAQVANLESQVKTRGISLEHNKSDGHLYQVSPDGTKKDIGVFDLTPEQTANLEVKTYGRKEGIQLGNAKNLFSFEEPTKNASITANHAANRKVDAANPIPSSSFDFTAPSQFSIADETAVRQVIRTHPEYAKFNVDDPSIAASRDQTGHANFIKLVQEARDKIVSNSMKRPLVTLPGQSPLGAPNSNNDQYTAEAIAQLKKDGKPQTPEMIEFVKKQLHPEL